MLDRKIFSPLKKCIQFFVLTDFFFIFRFKTILFVCLIFKMQEKLVQKNFFFNCFKKEMGIFMCSFRKYSTQQFLSFIIFRLFFLFILVFNLFISFLSILIKLLKKCLIFLTTKVYFKVVNFSFFKENYKEAKKKKKKYTKKKYFKKLPPPKIKV